jgi:hypothetical protein
MKDKVLVLKTGSIEELAATEVQARLGRERYGRIRARDGHPFFVEMIIAHEGVSSGRVVGPGLGRPTRKFWSRASIEELAEKTNSRPVPVFLFHRNDNPSRRKVGEIVMTVAQEVKDRFAALALAYISDPVTRELIRSRKLDTCSLEADLVFEQRPEGKGIADWVVNAIEKVSGLALGSRSFARPGFSGAAILGQVEEFEDAGDAGRAQEDELEKLRTELARFKQKQDTEDRQKKTAELVERSLSGRNLNALERGIVAGEVAERIELKAPDPDRLETVVQAELERELNKLTELKKIYQTPKAIRAPLEAEADSRRNPLIPEE